MKNKKTNSNAFSLAETIILIVVLAVVIAASTPFLTRKIQNISDAGSTIGGGAHGRVEIFYQEFLDCDDNLDSCQNSGYKKVYDEDTKADESVIIYQKLNDEQYKTVYGSMPNTPASGNKDVIYAEIGRGNPIKSPDGAIVGAKYGSTTYPTAPGNAEAPAEFVFENAYVTYEKDGEPLKKKDEYRIIDGNLTKFYGIRSISGVGNNKKCFIINSSNGKFHLRYRYFRWFRKYIGKSKEPSIDRAIETNELSSNNEFSLDLPTDTKGVTFHAVGGGGYGGSILSLNQPIMPSLSDPEKTIITNKLLTAYKKATGKTGLVEFNKPDSWFLNNDGLVVNTTDKTITGKIDLREGRTSVYPNKLLQYTQVLGTPSQKPVLYDMPDWFKGNMDGYRVGAVVCSGVGSPGAPSSFYVKHACSWMPKCSISCETKDECTSWGMTECPVHETPSTNSSQSYSGSTTNNNSGSSTGGGFGLTNVDSHYQTERFSNKNNEIKRIMTGFAANIKDGIWSFDNLKIKPDLDKIAMNDVNSAGAGCTPKYVCNSSKTVTNYKCTGTTYFSCSEGEDQKTTDGNNCPSVDSKCAYKEDTKLNCYGGPGGSGICAWASIPVRVNDKYSVVKKDEFEEAGYGTGRTLTLRVADSVAILKVMGGQNGQDCIGATTCDILDIGRPDCVSAVRKYGLGSALSMHMHNNNICNLLNNPSHSYTAGPGKDAGADDFDPPTPSCNWQGGGAIAQATDTSGVYWKKEAPTATDLAGYAKGFGTVEREYNHLYLWTIPYGINSLAYGEGGTPGEYVKANVKDASGKILIKLGEGGKRNNNGEGTSTTVNINNKKILEAKGGKAGNSNKKTDMFDMCFNLNQSTAPLGCGASGEIQCCEGHNAVKNTKNISATYIKYSAFEDISAYTNKSPIVGIGLGRGGMGSSSTTVVDEVKGSRKAFNISTAVGGSVEINSLTNTSSPGYPAPPQNKILVSSDFNRFGGGGAVIIMW